METPSPNGGNGRDPKTGRFADGWRGGPGNPNGKHFARWRQAVIDLGKELPEGMGEHCRERQLAMNLWADALNQKNPVRDRLECTKLIMIVYGGPKVLKPETEDDTDQRADPDALARDAAEHLRTLGLESVLPPGLKR